MGIIVIKYSLVAEVFETQDDLQGWTDAFDEEDSKLNVSGKFSQMDQYLVEIADGLRPLFNPLDSHEYMAPEIQTVLDLVSIHDSSRDSCCTKPQTSSCTYFSKLDASNLAQCTSSLPLLKVWRRMKKKARKREVSTGTWAGQQFRWLRAILCCW